MTAGVRADAASAVEHRALAEGGRIVWLRKVSVSIIDQALLSVLSLAIGLLFVRLSTKSEYALYSQMIALALLVTGAAASTINSPLASLLPQTPEPSRTQLASAGLRLLAILSSAVAAVVGLLVWLVPSLLAVNDPSPELVAVLILAILANTFRDFLRNLFFIRLRPLECLRLDAVYVGVCATALFTLFAFAEANAVSVLALTAAAGLLFLLPWVGRAALRAALPRGSMKEAWARIAPLAKWSLATLLVSSVNGAFPLLTTHVVGIEATADILAARLFVQPLGPVFVAWTNVFRPRIAYFFADGQRFRVRRLAVLSAFSMAFGILGYLSLVLLAYPFLEHYALGPAYRDLQLDVAWWGVGSLIAGVAGIGSGVLIAQGLFKQCFWSACAGNAASVPLLLVLGAAYGKSGVLAALALGNAISAIWILAAVARTLAPSGVSQP